MIMITRNPKNEITDTTKDNSIIISRLLGLLYNKTIVKNKSIKKIQHNYNYTDMQKITIVFSNGYTQEFDGIPTQWGLLNEIEVEKLLKGGEI